MSRKVVPSTWKEFMDSGLLWWVNRSLHLFGWSICLVEEDDGSSSSAYPAKTPWRGFNHELEEGRFHDLTRHLQEEMPRLVQETEKEPAP